MSPLQGQCPSCGAPVKFKVSTALVTICEFCRSAVGRGDKKLEDLGKIADVTDTGSPLDLWLKGRYNGVPFALTGRVQYSHPAGGTWDEWYAHFADERWGWLSEAQGRFYLTFEAESSELPDYDDLELGQKLVVGVDQTKVMVAEKNLAKTAAAKGEIPYLLEPGVDHPFADCYGPNHTFATLDYSDDEPALYLGKEVTLDELGIPKSAKAGRRDERRVEALALSCPNCGGALSLRAPDEAKRVGCPSCGSLLDVNQGQLSLLESLHPPAVTPAIPLGTVGEMEGAKLTTLGYLQRSVTIEGEKFYWMEYLLYEPRLGYRWLVKSDNHWNYVRPLPPGEVEGSGIYNSSVRYRNQDFKLFQQSKATVEFVIGEFYWKVRTGEEVWMRDFIHPPLMLSQEVTGGGANGEINWSHAEYVSRDEIERAFNVTGLPAPIGVGANQPFPYSPVYRQFAWMIAAAFLLLVVAWWMTPQRRVLARSIQVAAQPQAQGIATKQIVFDAEPFNLVGRRNVRIKLQSQSPVWVYIEGELAPKDRPKRTSFTLLAQPFQSGQVYLTAQPAGEYVLDLKVQWPDPKQAAAAELTIDQGVVHPLPFVLMLMALAAVPVGVGLYHALFEGQRWQNSYLADPEPVARREGDKDDAVAANVDAAPIPLAEFAPQAEVPKWLRNIKRNRPVPPGQRGSSE